MNHEVKLSRMRKGNIIFIGIIIIALVIGIVLMFANEKAFNEITGVPTTNQSSPK